MEWMWRERLKGEEEGVDTMQGINKVLLENLLPAHVARHFLTIIKVGSCYDALLVALSRSRLLLTFGFVFCRYLCKMYIKYSCKRLIGDVLTITEKAPIRTFSIV